MDSSQKLYFKQFLPIQLKTIYKNRQKAFQIKGRNR